MQRQSLGSPGSSSSPSTSPSDDSSRPRRKPGYRSSTTPPHPSSAAAGSTIHLIPALTLFCFLVLYLLSHDPSPTDMAAAFGLPADAAAAALVSGTTADSAGSGVASSASELSGHRELKQTDRRQLHRPQAGGGGRSSRKLRGGGGGRYW